MHRDSSKSISIDNFCPEPLPRVSFAERTSWIKELEMLPGAFNERGSQGTTSLCSALQNWTDPPVGSSYVRGSCTDKELFIFRVYGVVRLLGENIKGCVKRLGF